MVNLPPPEPNDRQPVGRPRDNDEAIAVTIALLSVGAILWWGWTRGQQFFAPVLNLPEVTGTSIVEEDDLLSLDAAEGDSSSPIQDNRRPLFGNSDRNAPEATNRMDSAEDLNGAQSRQNSAQSAVPGVVAGTALNDSSASGGATTPTDATSASESLPELDISDVSSDYWAYPYIVSLYEANLLPDLPSGELQPDKELTRAEMAALLNSSFVGDAQSRRSLSFSDVPGDFWATDAIRQVVEAGYMTGYPDGTFKPNGLVPRYQVLVTMATGLELAPSSDVDGTLNQLQGTQELPAWSRPQVAAAVTEGLAVNHPDPQQLEPQQPATRADLIAIIHQALVAQGELEPVDTPYAVPAQ